MYFIGFWLLLNPGDHLNQPLPGSWLSPIMQCWGPSLGLWWSHSAVCFFFSCETQGQLFFSIPSLWKKKVTYGPRVCGHRTTFVELVFLLPPLRRFGDSSSGLQAFIASFLTGLSHLASPSIPLQVSLLNTLLFSERFTQKASLPQVSSPRPPFPLIFTLHLNDLSGGEWEQTRPKWLN